MEATHRDDAFWIRVGLTICVLEFFGPIVRDFGDSHALNPTWVGHARVHLVWLLGFMLFSGIVNLYLIWVRRSAGLGDLWLSAVWQSCNLAGFWFAFLLLPVYDGDMTIPGVHTQMFGIDENVFVFTLLSVLMAAILVALRRAERTHA